jgi:hypothetical protein
MKKKYYTMTHIDYSGKTIKDESISSSDNAEKIIGNAYIVIQNNKYEITCDSKLNSVVKESEVDEELLQQVDSNNYSSIIAPIA